MALLEAAEGGLSVAEVGGELAEVVEVAMALSDAPEGGVGAVAEVGTVPQPVTPQVGTVPQAVTPHQRKREGEETVVSPWKKPKLAVARRPGVVPVAESLQKLASTLSNSRPLIVHAGPPETLLAIWQGMKSQRSTFALILGYQPQLNQFRRGISESSSITAWGLDGTGSWCKFTAYEDTALRFLEALQRLEGGSGFLKMSSVKHERNMVKPIEGAMAFKMETSCQFASAGGFPNGESPVPALNSNFAEYANVSATTRCFVLAKIAEVYDLDPAQQTHSAKLRLRLMDLSGHVRNLTIWPPNCHSQIWQQDAVVKNFGLTANMQYHNFSAGSDTVVELDEELANEFPSAIVSTKWELTARPIED